MRSDNRFIQMAKQSEHKLATPGNRREEDVSSSKPGKELKPERRKGKETSMASVETITDTLYYTCFVYESCKIW